MKICIRCGRHPAAPRYKVCGSCRHKSKEPCKCGGLKMPGSTECRNCKYKGSNKILTRHREYLLNERYGVSLADYDKILTAQKGVCAICKRPPKKYRLAVDHNHESGQVRGLLCTPCNRALGTLETFWSTVHAYICRGSHADICSYEI